MFSCVEGKASVMNTQELAEELRHPDAQELLRSCPLARLTYNGHDGLPR